MERSAKEPLAAAKIPRIRSGLAVSTVAQARGGNEARIYARGDRRVVYGTMMKVLGRLSSAGFHRVALVTEFEQDLKAK